MTTKLHISTTLSHVEYILEAKGPRSKRYTVEELLARIDEQTTVDARGCWLWQGYTKNGYGSLSVHDSNTYVHQLSYLLRVGPITDGLFVLHRCDVRRCHRPEHLFLGTQQDNVDDMHAKQRHVDPPHRTGIANPKATKTDDVVLRARAMRAEGITQRDVAARLGVSQSTISRWTHRQTRSAA